jgi:hypothetical protein
LEAIVEADGPREIVLDVDRAHRIAHAQQYAIEGFDAMSAINTLDRSARIWSPATSNRRGLDRWPLNKAASGERPGARSGPDASLQIRKSQRRRPLPGLVTASRPMLSYAPPSHSRTLFREGARARTCWPVAGSVSHHPAAGNGNRIAPMM